MLDIKGGKAAWIIPTDTNTPNFCVSRTNVIKDLYQGKVTLSNFQSLSEHYLVPPSWTYNSSSSP